MLAAHLFCQRFLLFLAGDIHPNPGPLHGKLKFAHWNLNSILTRNKSKISLIEALQATESFDIFAVSESFLNDNAVKDDLEIHGFYKDPIRADCPLANIHPKGGVCLYYRENLPLKHRKDLQMLDQTIVCEIKLDRTKKLFFILSYRSPSQDATQTRNYFKNLEKMIAKIKLENPAIIVLTGDLNARSPLLWSGEQDENLAGKQLAELITMENMDQIIDEPTHMPSDTTSTCIDLIITSNPSAIIDHGVLPSLDSRCKHQIIYSQINFHVPPPPKYKRTIWDYKACNLNALKRDLFAINWPIAFENLNVNQMVDKLTSTLLDLAKTHIPFKIAIISDKDAPWFNNRLRYAIQKNKRLVKLWKANGKTPADTIRKNRSQRDLHKLITEAKSSYIENLGKKISDPNTGAKIFWSSYKRLINNKKNTNIPPLLENGIFLSNFKEKAFCFNKLFAGHCNTLDNDSVLPPSPTPLTNNTLGNVTIRTSDILSIIEKLNPKKAHGVDGVSIELIKKCKNEIALPLKIIFEKCLETGSYPSLWKKANIQPVHKKDSRQIATNYRPISLLCICGKFFEKIIFDQMYTFFNDNNLITEHQSGFRPGDSTINQLTSISHEIYSAFEQYDETRAIFLDISKAFDKTWHDGLIFKLKKFGVSGNLINLLTNYLSDRYQRVVLNGQESDWEKINAGVPQGSVLGPLLFLVYINDLIDGISSNIKLFADDSSLFTRVRNDVTETHERLTQDLAKITEWAHMWKFRFNPDLTKQAIEIVFSCKYEKTKPIHPPLTFNNIPVARKSSTKHLGLILDERLVFAEHIKEAIDKAKKGIALMKFLANKVSASVLELTYKMYVRPHLDYGDVIYHNQHSISMELLEKIQYQAGLIISNCWKGTSRVKLYKELGWESLSQRRAGRRYALYHKILNNRTPSYLKNHIQPFVPRTDRFKNSFFPFCAENWPSIPDELKQAPSSAAFKNAYKKTFIPPKPGYFGICDKFGIRLLTKIRVDCSDLRDHRYNHGFRNCPSPMCRCNTADETSEHFLARCPLFDAQRVPLLTTISSVLSNDISVLPDSHLSSLFMYGSKAYNSVTNKLILEATITYIKRTKRFSKLEAFSITEGT
ncbi:MAG: hypothetical protein MK234_03870 [Nitrospinales bacterium]|nr:hypothetical protein [Nitrospinales bacterium]